MKRISKTRLAQAAIAAVLVLSLARLAAFIAHDPLLAYANNFDMIRLQACDQLWPAHEPPKAGQQSPDAPIEYYVKEQGRAPFGVCYPYSERVFTALLGSTLEEKEIFSIRKLAGLKIALSLTAAGLVLIALYRTSPQLSAIAAIVTAILLTDPFNTLYLSTFYTEWSAFLGFLLSTLMLLLALTRPNSWLYTLGLAAALTFWGLSKMQHVIMPVLALVCLLPVCMRFGWRRFLLPVLGVSSAALVVILVQASWVKQERNQTVNAANAVNTYLYTVLASSRDPARLADRLGLPRKCADHAGKSWYTQGFDPKNDCPEVIAAPRLRLIALPFLDPTAFVQMLSQSDDSIRPVFPRLLGQVAGQNLGRASSYVWSLFSWIDLLPFWLLATIAISVCCCSAAYSLRQLFGSRCEIPGQAAASTVVFFLSCMVPTVYFVALFGDGFADLDKHTQLAFNGLIALCAISVWFLIVRSAAAFAERQVDPA